MNFILPIFNVNFNNSTLNSENIEGESFVYEVLKSNLDLTFNKEHFSSNTFQIERIQFPTSDNVHLFVDNYSSEKIYYTISCANYQETDHSMYNPSKLESYLIGIFTLYLDLPFAIASSLVRSYEDGGNYAQSYFRHGLRLFAVYFLPVSTPMWMIMDEINTWFNNQSGVNTLYYAAGTARSECIIDDDFVHLEIWFHGTLDYESFDGEKVEGDVNSGFLTVYNKTNGVLLGLRYLGTFNGKINNKKVDFIDELQLELLSFDLPSLSLYSVFTPNASIYNIFFLTISSIVVAVSFRKIMSKD